MNMLFGDWVEGAPMVENCWVKESFDFEMFEDMVDCTGDCMVCWIGAFVLNSICIELKSPMLISPGCWVGAWEITGDCWVIGDWTGVGFCWPKKFTYWLNPCCCPMKFVPNC